MHRYIAFAWNSRDQRQAQTADALNERLPDGLPGWQPLYRSAGVAAYHSGASRSSNVYLLMQERGVVIGTLFSANGTLAVPAGTAIGERDTTAFSRSGAVALVENYWGRYIGLIRPADSEGVWVVRDPTAALPCFGTRYQGIDVVFSDIDDCVALGLIDARINWDHLAAYLCFAHLVTSHTGLEGVYQLQAGEQVLIGTEKPVFRSVWNPVEVCSRRLIEDPVEAAHELRSAVQRSVRAWASCFDSLLLELSGGLDSSIVLSCLASMRNSPRFVCENHFSRDAGGDERGYARKAARSMGVELIETPILPSRRPIQAMFDDARVASPALMTFIPDTHSQRAEIVDARSIEAVFSGQGGDHLFQSIRTREIAAEYAYRHGVDRTLFRIVADTSRLTRTSFWAVLKVAVLSGLFHRSGDPYAGLKPSSLLGADRLKADLLHHPWVDLARRLPGSKRRQIFDLVDTQNFQRRPAARADVIHPLISQPVIETCLQIPSYVLTFDGRDRALARQAFDTILPGEIVNRTTKGATTSYFNDVLVDSLPSLREFLLDGLLMAGGLLDKARVTRSLSEAALIRGSDLLFPILDAARAEIWLRSWSAPDRRTFA